MATYQGHIIDRYHDCATMWKTRRYTTWEQAQHAAEALLKRKLPKGLRESYRILVLTFD